MRIVISRGVNMCTMGTQITNHNRLEKSITVHVIFFLLLVHFSPIVFRGDNIA